MRSFFTWRVNLTLILLAFSVVFYFINYLFFRDVPAMLRLLTLQLAFTPISVILITVFLNQLLSSRERRHRLEKLNMVIGAFFSEVGTALLQSFSEVNTQREELSKKLLITGKWTPEEFKQASQFFRDYSYKIELKAENAEALRRLLVQERPFFLRLLENQNLLEHESFTNLLWATMHLTEELAHRKNFAKLPPSDMAHLANDTKRAYGLLMSQWIAYMKHLKESYPYLFSLALRTNPFDPNASVEVKQVRRSASAVVYLFSAMEINWLGHSCFRLKGKNATVITDPYSPDLGYTLEKPAARIVTVSHQHPAHNYVPGVLGEPRVVSKPGGYEVGGVLIIGIGSFHDNEKGAALGKNTIFVFEMDELRLCHLGDLGHVLTADQAEEIGSVDVLMIPVGGGTTISTSVAAEVVRQLEPKIVLPMHYKTPAINRELEAVDRFLQEMGVPKPEPQPKLMVTKSNLPLSLQITLLQY